LLEKEINAHDIDKNLAVTRKFGSDDIFVHLLSRSIATFCYYVT